ncbi:glycosyltransferase family 2 protein [Desulfobacterales bacterium]|nr:glycosyltransferase family 2 protein [Desulfobacterales bacterium]
MSTSQPIISVIIPTKNRLRHLPSIIECFNKQSWENKQLLILDDTENNEETITNLQLQNPEHKIWWEKPKLSLGEKRNRLIAAAGGDIIAHFDDDDYYAPNYLETLQNLLSNQGNDLAKLSGWFCYHEASESFGYWDTKRSDLPHIVFSRNEKLKYTTNSFSKEDYRSFLIGYGFSYIYYKKVWEKVKFPDSDFAEDSTFIELAIKQYFKVGHIQDGEGICLHIIHKENTSKCFPNYLIPRILESKYFDYWKKKISS